MPKRRVAPIKTSFSGQPVSKCSTIAMPPSSAAHVVKFSRLEAISVTTPKGMPRRVRTTAKPSRFGRLRELLAFYDHCEANGIGLYGGGMFELGPGRGQVQYLASLFHPDAPNDVAPGDYNDPEPRPGLPGSPLEPAPEPVGFRWG